jgi:regulator of sirC expression with transglutaminase-like and TPR domain
MDTLSKQLKKAYLHLLDDEDIIVRKGLADALRNHGEEGVAFLNGILDGSSEGLARHARYFLRELGEINTVSEFREFIGLMNYELETGSLLLERTVHVDRSVEDYQNLLNEMAGRVKELLVENASPRQTCEAINRVLFHEYEFRGAVEDFYNPQNSFLGVVLERRRGIPLSLSLVYQLVAGRCNFHLEPLGFPIRFMLGCFEGVEPFFIDPFTSGTILSRGDIENFLRENGVYPEDAFFQPTPVGEILCRCCRNLAHQYDLANQSDLSDRFSSFVDEFERVYQEHSAHK